MLTNILIFICVLFLSFLSYKYAVGRPKGFPPGPPRIPFFGSYLLMMLSDFTYMHKAVLKFSQWYNSDIVGFYFGPFPVVAAHSARGVREILLNSDFDGRPQIFLAAMRHPDFEIKGIFFKDGPIWKEQRRFMLRHLRDFGFGRRFAELEQVIQDEISEMLDMIRNGPRYPHEKQIVNSNAYRILLPYALSFPSANSFFHIMYNERHSRSEQADLTELVKYIMQFQRLSDDYGKMLTILPWVRHIFPKWSSYDLLMESNKFMYNFFANIVDRHVSSFDETYERNFLDIYIKQWKQNDGQNNEDISFNREQLIMSLIDFSLPPITAVSTQISLLIQQLLLQPYILKRVQLEIDDVVGSGRLPSLEDRAHLHYTEATIREGMRLDTLVPSDILHKSLVDTELLGYKIPKNTVVVPSLYAYHNDKRVWGDPNVFRPERFLDDDGRFCSKKDLSFPFGAGKRLCAGETFARNMLFLIFVSLCQNFNFVLGPDDKLPDLSKRLSGLIISPRDFWIQFEERN